MAKIGFVLIAHEDYFNDDVSVMARKAAKSLEEMGVEVCEAVAPALNSVSAEMAGRQMIHEEVDGVILFLGSWMECPVAMSVIREVEHLPLCLWGFPMFGDGGALRSTGSYVSFAMFKGTMERVGYRYKPVLGLPGERETLVQLEAFCRAASAVQRLKRTRIGLVGYTSMGIYPGTFDHVFLRAKIGPEVEQIDSYTLINRAEALKESDCTEMLRFFTSSARIRNDVTQEQLLKAARLAVALQQLAEQRHLQSVNVKCQYEFSKEYKMVTCVPLSALAEFGIVASCEGDMLNTVSMVMLHLLSGQTVSYGDAINHSGNTVKLSSCGFAPFSLGEAGTQEIRKFMPHPGFSGIQNSFVLKPGRVTVMRLVEDRCDYHIVYFAGEGLKTQLREGCMPALDVRLDGNVSELVKHYAGQHYAICYGDLSEEIEALAAMLEIKTVNI